MAWSFVGKLEQVSIYQWLMLHGKFHCIKTINVRHWNVVRVRSLYGGPYLQTQQTVLETQQYIPGTQQTLFQTQHGIIMLNTITNAVYRNTTQYLQNTTHFSQSTKQYLRNTKQNSPIT